jgi:hypothetical protein
MSPRYHETLEQVRVGLDAFEICISSQDVSLVPRKSLLEPLENSGRASSVSGSVSNGSTRVRSQKGKHFIPTRGQNTSWNTFASYASTDGTRGWTLPKKDSAPAAKAGPL